MRDKLLLILLSSVVTLLFVEVIIRFFLPQSDRFYQTDMHLGSRLKDNFQGTWYGEYAVNKPEFANRVITNHHGFHDTDHTFKNPDNLRRVVILGDSFIEALQVSLHQTTGRLLETLLNKGDEKWEVISLARAGNSTAEEIILWEEWGRKFKPEYVVLVFAKNDLLENERLSRSTFSRPRFWLENNHLYRAKPLLIPRFTLLNFIADSSHLTRFLYRFRFNHEARLEHSKLINQEELAELTPTLSVRLIQLLVNKFEADGIKTIVVFIDDDKIVRKKLQDILLILDLHETPYFFFGNKYQSGNEKFFFPSDGHLTPAGHKQLSEKINRALLNYNL